MQKFTKNKLLMLFIFFFSIISIVSSSIAVYFTIELINSVSSGVLDNKFNLNLIIVISLTVVFIISTIIQLLLKNKWKLIISQLLSKGAISKISSLSANDVKQNKEGKYLVWINKRIPEIETFIFESFFNVLVGFIIQITTLAVMFALSWKLALIGLGILIVSFIIPILLSIIAGKMHKQYMSNMEKYISSLQNVFNSFKFLWYLNKEEKIITFIDEIVKKWLKETEKTQGKVIIFELFNTSFQFFSYITMLILTAFFILKQNENIALIFSFPGYFFSLGIQLRYVIYMNQNYAAYKGYLKDFSLEKPIIVNPNAPINIDKIEIKDLSFSYGEKTVFKNFNYTFKKGKKYAIVGKSGSGKSTLLNLLLKQINDYNGQININQTNLKEIPISKWNNSFTYLSNQENLFFDNIYNNITLWDTDKDEQVKDALKQANMEDFDLNYKIESDSSLSTGQKQKINFARHFYRNKNVLILDEATSNLDKDSTDNLFKKILHNNELLLINSTHHLDNSTDYDGVINLEELEIN
ncbi:ABC-type multidrug transport system fused ATPase/permease subunit [Mycoplasmopsis mustelae]|uniref:ABC-type multidrug transport system fused ATPase/permease subunit n=1 Tax=Mycoplasmopsis mustelae TaxID=171289 RepID=A0A4V3FNZ0_9BACT|nr:ABC transporter ATP-binding protein [Mycoplasmopsis mustelae]TDV24420.1 ABC-type multidrug transport system fused ATPase/permease subunit [Mycoplasmopsis mustelae]